jgi:hypothetical protein
MLHARDHLVAMKVQDSPASHDLDQGDREGGYSVRWHAGRRQQSSGNRPIVIRPEFKAEPFVTDPQITIAAARDRVGSHHLYFLRDHSDIRLVAAVIGEAIVTKTVVKPAEQHDIVLEIDVRAASTATASATAESSAATAAEASTTAAAEAPTTAASKCCGPATAGEPRGAATISASASAVRARRACSHISAGRRAVAHRSLAIAGRSAGACLPVCPAAIGALTAIASLRAIGDIRTIGAAR